MPGCSLKTGSSAVRFLLPLSDRLPRSSNFLKGHQLFFFSFTSRISCCWRRVLRPISGEISTEKRLIPRLRRIQARDNVNCSVRAPAARIPRITGLLSAAWGVLRIGMPVLWTPNRAWTVGGKPVRELWLLFHASAQIPVFYAQRDTLYLFFGFFYCADNNYTGYVADETFSKYISPGNRGVVSYYHTVHRAPGSVTCHSNIHYPGLQCCLC